MGKRKAHSQVEDLKSNKEECLSDSNGQPQQALCAPQVQESSSSNAAAELIKAQAALKALESRFAEVVAENAEVVAENKVLRMQTKQVQALQTQNQQLQAQLARQEQELSRSRALVHDSTFEVDDLKKELAFFR